MFKKKRTWEDGEVLEESLNTPELNKDTSIQIEEKSYLIPNRRNSKNETILNIGKITEQKSGKY